MPVNLKSKRVLITGASRGIGREIALRAAEAGAEVIALSMSQTNLDKLQQELPGITTIACDLANWEATRAALENIGHIDCLVNNAGVIHLQSFLEVTEEGIDKTFAVNYKAVINVSQIIAKQMIADGQGGSIVNVSSAAAKSPVHAKFLTYCGSKCALDMVTRSMAKELGEHQIRVNSINPSAVLTDMLRVIVPDFNNIDPSVTENSPLKRLVTVEDVANAVLFLLSDEAQMITGVALLVDGGLQGCK